MPEHTLFPSIIPTAAPAGQGAGADGCPFCDEYDGEHVARHASKAHPEQWAARTDGGS